jgi:tetratricopeptide (TPR) repeat protein
VAQQASVVGAIFWLGAVAYLAGLNADLGAPLATLERRDFVYARPESTVSGDREFAFKHMLIRDVAYERLPKGRRAELHVLFSEWLGGLPVAADEFVEIYAYHLEQACRLAREVVRSPIEPPVAEAAEALKRAAEKAERREGAREARRFYERALELVGDEHPALACELRFGRGRALARVGEVAAALEELGWVADHAADAGRVDLRGTALVQLAGMELAHGRADVARTYVEEAAEIAQVQRHRELEIRAAYVTAALRGDFDGEVEAAVEHLRDALAMAEELDHLPLRVEGHLRAGFVLFNKGELERAEEHLLRCTALAEELGSLRDQARATFLLGLMQYYRGDLDEAERLGLQTAEWLDRTGDGFFQVQNLVRALGVYALARNELGLAEQRLTDALPLALEHGGAGGYVGSETYRYLVETLVRQGRAAEAAELVEFAGRDVPAENLYASAEIALAESFVFAAQGNAAEATARVVEAIGLLERQELAVEVAEARISFARMLDSLGDQRSARDQLEQARTSLTAIGATRLVAEVDAMLAKTAVGPA